MHNVVTDELGPIDPPPDSNRVAGVLWRYAREHDADLIVMATHGRGGLLRAWLGSVANSLIRRASRPVLLVRPQDEVFGSALEADRGIRHIVVPLDGSTTAEQVIPYALAVGSPYGARYSLVRVIFPPEWNAYQSWAARVAALGVSPPIFMESDAAPSLSRQEVAESLESVANRMREGGVSVTAHVLEEFSPAEAIVQYAQAHAADAVAVSTGGVGGVPRLLLGSVADRIVRTSEIPVLVCNVRRLEPVTEPANEAVAATSQLREET
jgi:nucleotide-binding universal stress UspA family protein